MKTGLRIIDRYIATEILVTWLAVMFVLVLVLMSAELARQLSWLAEGRIQGSSLAPLVANSMAGNLIKIMPLSLLLAVLLAFGRLYKDSEMAAMMSAAMGPASWYRPVLMIAVPASLLLLLLSLYAMPELNHRKSVILDEARSRSDLSSMMAGRFNPSGSGNAVFFLETQHVGDRRSDGIFFRRYIDGVEQLDIAASASNRSDEHGATWLVMHDGRQYIGDPGQTDFRIIDYGEYAIRLQPPEMSTGRSLKSMPSAQLYGSVQQDEQAELQWRVMMPVAMLILAALALPLSYMRPRSGRYSKLAIALLVYIVYANLLGISKRWIEDGTLSVWLGSSWPHLAILSLLLLLLWKQGYLAVARRPGQAS